jgi:hypothetical protein
MEMQRFDALARHFGQGGSRRHLLGLLSGTALGGLIAAGLASDADAKKRKKKKKCKKCGECQTCRKGRCKAKVDGTACSLGSCAGGVCTCPDEATCCTNSDDCPAGSGQTCQGGACTCLPGQEDSGGVCGTPPTCLGFFRFCNFSSDCCSNLCTGINTTCYCSDVGEACAADTDCCSGTTCRGFACRAA